MGIFGEIRRVVIVISRGFRLSDEGGAKGEKVVVVLLFYVRGRIKGFCWEVL